MSRPKRALVIDDDPDLLDLVRFELEEEGFKVTTAGSTEEGIDRLRDSRPELVVLDLHLPGRSGFDFLESANKSVPDLPVIVLTAEGKVSDVVKCMRMGAFDFVQKPFDRTRLLTSVRNGYDQRNLQRKLERVTDELRRDQGFAALSGQSPQLAETVALLRRAANSNVSVLLTGESGTGKEVAARALHAESQRRSGPFVAVNCSAIPENLIESELFGHEAGAFTGAGNTRIGQFEQADGGTLFLDEIGELRPDLQVRLLRVLQERVIDRVGGNQSIPVDVRILAATHRDLRADSVAGRFREDLFYRLAVYPVDLPPLRERQGDLEILAREFLNRFAASHNRNILGIHQEAWRALLLHRWPGNIRELMNVIERATIIEDSDLITLKSLPLEVRIAATPEISNAVNDEDVDGIDFANLVATNIVRSTPPTDSRPSTTTSTRTTATVAAEHGTRVEFPPSENEIIPFETQEARIIRQALARCNWNVKLAAKKLGLGRATIYRKIEKYGLNRELNLR